MPDWVELAMMFTISAIAWLLLKLFGINNFALYMLAGLLLGLIEQRTR